MQKSELTENPQLPLVCCKYKTKTASFRMFAANGNGSLLSLVGKR